ncbi:MAG: hypothetical protein FWD25_01265 [Clostridia bacterium]|nr:hypothetical protein [Clostridia bacterium]
MSSDLTSCDASFSIPNEETYKAIDDVANRRNLSRLFSSVTELMEDLCVDDPITAKIEAELDRRSGLSKNPDTKWYSTEEVRLKFGLEP